MNHHPDKLWLAEAPMILASKSSARRQLLESAGIQFVVEAPDIDERQLDSHFQSEGARPDQIARALACAKAAAVSTAIESQLVLGADQVLSLNGRRFNKPKHLDEAADQLQRLSGRTHELYSAISIWRDGQEIFAGSAKARMTMRPLSPLFIQRYISVAGNAILNSVGAYQFEGTGIHLFDAVDGDQSTILGLPLFALLKFLRANGNLAA